DARAENFGVEILDIGFDLDPSERIDGTFVDGEGEIECRTIRRELGDGGNDVEIRVTVTQIEATELLAVEGEAVGIVVVVGGEELPPGAFLGRDIAAQGIVVEHLVADEGDAGNACGGAFVDREDEIDAVLRTLDDLRIDGG